MSMWGIIVDVVRVILQGIPQKDLVEGVEQGDIGPHHVGEDSTLWHLVTDEVLRLQLEGHHYVLYLKR